MYEPEGDGQLEERPEDGENPVGQVLTYQNPIDYTVTHDLLSQDPAYCMMTFEMYRPLSDALGFPIASDMTLSATYHPDPYDPPPGQSLTFDRVTLAKKPGAAWLTPVDLDGDGYDELVLSTLFEGLAVAIPPIGNGGAYILSRDGGASTDDSIGQWSVDPLFTPKDGIGFPNSPVLMDVDNDGVEDIVVPCGFLLKPTGRIVWMKGEPVDGQLTYGPPQDIPIPDSSRWYHAIVPADLTGNGRMDFVTTNHDGTLLSPGTSKVEWFENVGGPGEARFVHHHIADRGGSHLALYDMTGNGKQDIILPQYFDGPSLIWLEQPDTPDSDWKEHVINDTTGRGFGIEVVDIDGDGRPELVYGNHNHQGAADPAHRTMGVYWFDIPAPSEVRDLNNWDDHMHVVHEGFHVRARDPNANAAPGVVHVGDVTGNGRMDITVSGDGDDGLYIFTQQDDGTFEKVVVDRQPMSGDHHLMDVNGDGRMDVVWTVFGEVGLRGPRSMVYAYIQKENGQADNEKSSDKE